MDLDNINNLAEEVDMMIDEEEQIEVVEERKRSNSLGSAISSNSRNIQQRKPAPWHVTKKRVIWKDGLLQKCLRNFVNKFPDLKIVGGGSTV